MYEISRAIYKNVREQINHISDNMMPRFSKRGIVTFVVGINFAGEPILSPLTPTLSITPTPTPATTTPPTPTPCIIDRMNNTWGWKTYREDNKSSIIIKSIVGRTGNAIEISYDLKKNGSVSIYKEINPERLFEKEGILFFL